MRRLITAGATTLAIAAALALPALGNGNHEEEHKVTICHLPPGNPGNGQIIEIDKSAWEQGGPPGHHGPGLHGGDFEITSDEDEERCKGSTTTTTSEDSTTTVTGESSTTTEAPTTTMGSTTSSTSTSPSTTTPASTTTAPGETSTTDPEEQPASWSATGTCEEDQAVLTVVFGEGIRAVAVFHDEPAGLPVVIIHESGELTTALSTGQRFTLAALGEAGFRPDPRNIVVDFSDGCETGATLTVPPTPADPGDPAETLPFTGTREDVGLLASIGGILGLLGVGLLAVKGRFE